MSWLDDKIENEIKQLDHEAESKKEELKQEIEQAEKQEPASDSEQPAPEEQESEPTTDRRPTALKLHRYYNFNVRIKKKKAELAALEKRIKDLEKLQNAPKPTTKGKKPQ